jgi:ABC-type siderophore export system fused ATPase/permease subunit
VRKTIQHLLAEYGTVAVVVYFTIFFTVLGAAWIAIHLGWRPDSVAGNVGSFTAAYLATKVTQPIRIASTLALTPLAARVYERFARKEPAPAPAPIE